MDLCGTATIRPSALSVALKCHSTHMFSRQPQRRRYRNLIKTSRASHPPCGCALPFPLSAELSDGAFQADGMIPWLRATPGSRRNGKTSGASAGLAGFDETLDPAGRC